MAVYLFPGQGSQHIGMGKDLFDQFPDITSCTDDILGYSIRTLCLEDPDRQLGQTQYTQPALYTVNALSYLRRLQESEQEPRYLAGHSLGEYNALFASGAIDFATGLRLVKKRGELMSQVSGGGMLAVIGLNADQVEAVIKENRLYSIEISNYNADSQIVVGGPQGEIERALPLFEARAKMCIRLKVSGAFHTSYMNGAKEQFKRYMESFEFGQIRIPVISNLTAKPYGQDEIKANLAEQITASVRWNDSIRYLMRLGETEFSEVGPGNVLTKLIGKIREEEKTANTAEGVGRSFSAETVTVQPIEWERGSKPSYAALPQTHRITAEMLGSSEFKQDYKLKYAYLSGAMYKGIASPEMVIKMGKSGMMGFLGTGGLTLTEIEAAIRKIQSELTEGQSYGVNLLHNPANPNAEEEACRIYMNCGVKTIDASAFMSITPALVLFKARGFHYAPTGELVSSNKIIAKISRPEVAEAFLSPAPERIVKKLLQEGKISLEQAEKVSMMPMADDICVEADSGGHTDQGVAYALMPAIIKLRDRMMEKYQYRKKVRVGAAGGIGTPEAAAAAFILGADFIMTGSINQCTVEAKTSSSVKELLSSINVQDTDYAPAGDMFEIGAKVQVLKRGVLFPARANKLYDLYQKYSSLDDIDDKTRNQIQEKYFKRSFDQVYNDCKQYYPPQEIERAERNPKYKMAMVFKWYFAYSTRLALQGIEEMKVDYQVHCGPALGSFNQWVKGTSLENWRNRHVDEIGHMMMKETAQLLQSRFNQLTNVL
ncbi:ACP S-malonyltransferase [Paenibacillaceae sp. P-4]|uniref:ACP S-malonyltransferase n=1 Tax=Paenibacillaceae bacterium P-4 TaxID=3160969 RepID=UPI0032E82F16